MAKHKQTIKNLKKTSTPIVTNKAVTIVEQGPKDEQSRVDGYGNQIKIDTTKYSDALNKYADDLYGSYTGMQTALGNKLGSKLKSLSKLPALKKISQIIKSLNPSNIIARIEQSVLGGRSLKSVISSAMDLARDGKQVYDDFRKDALGALEKYAPGFGGAGMNVANMIRTGKMAYAEAKFIHQVIKDNNWSSLTGIMSGLDAIGGTQFGQLLKPIVDLQATSAFLNDMVVKAADAGLFQIPGVAKEFKKLFGIGTSGNKAVAGTFINAAARSDLDSIDQIVNWLGQNENLAYNPESINYVLSYFNLMPGYSEEEALNQRRKLLDVLNKVDPNWYKDIHNGKEITKLGPFLTMSPDSKKLLSIEVPGERSFRTEIMIAESYPEQDIKQLVMQRFSDINYKDRPTNPIAKFN